MKNLSITIQHCTCYYPILMLRIVAYRYILRLRDGLVRELFTIRLPQYFVSIYLIFILRFRNVNCVVFTKSAVTFVERNALRFSLRVVPHLESCSFSRLRFESSFFRISSGYRCVVRRKRRIDARATHVATSVVARGFGSAAFVRVHSWRSFVTRVHLFKRHDRTTSVDRTTALALIHFAYTRARARARKRERRTAFPSSACRTPTWPLATSRTVSRHHHHRPAERAYAWTGTSMTSRKAHLR